MMTSVKKFIIYTDGSSTTFHDKTGLKYGGIGVFFGDNSNYNISKSYKGRNVTNQRMELQACISGIKKCIEIVDKKQLWELTIYTDSMYTINCINEWAKKWILWGWKRKIGKQYKEIKNLDLIKELYKLSKLYSIKYIHRKAHQSEPSKDNKIIWKTWYGNKMADKLAGDAMAKSKTLSLYTEQEHKN